MKRYTCILLSILICSNLICCTGRKASPSPGTDQNKQGDEKESDEKIDKKEGRQLLDRYMRALILRDAGKVNNFYSENLKQQAASFSSQPNPHPNGYKIDSVDEKEGKLEAKTKLLSVYDGEPYFSSDESKFTIIKQKGSYVIDKIEPGKSTEVVERDKILYIIEDGDVKGKELLRIDKLQGYAVPQGATPDQKYPVGKDKFGPIAGDGEGKKLAISTVGTYASLMVMDVKEKKATAIDLFLNASVRSLAWSQDGNFLAAEMLDPAGTKFLYIYDVEKGVRINDPIKNIITPGKYSVNTPYWISEKELVFNVTGSANLTADEQKNIGAYKLDAKTLSLTKY